MASNGWQYADTWAKKASQPAPTLVGGSKKHGGPDLGPTRARKQWAKLGVDGLGLADAPPPPGFQGLPRLTVEMAARLQTLPDNWTLAGTKTHRYRQVGNALPPRLAYAVAQRVSETPLPQKKRIGSKTKLAAYLRSRVGKVVRSRELQEASGGAAEWARRIRDLRSEGWDIKTHNDLSSLKPGEYILASDPPLGRCLQV